MDVERPISMSKYLISALLLLGLVTLKMELVSEAADAPVHPSEPIAYSDSLLNQSPIEDVRMVEAIVTAYSSRVGETDNTPYTTAAGTTVRTGVAAANWLPLGTKIKIPDIFGDQVFVIEDRMHEKNSDKVDVWFASTQEALRFGVRRTRVEIL